MSNSASEKRASFFPGYYVVHAAMLISLVSGGTTTLAYYVNGLMVNAGLIDSTVSGMCTSIVSICSVLFSATCGMMHRKLGNKKAIMIGFLVPIIGFALEGTLGASNYLMIGASFLYGFCLVCVSKLGTPVVVRKWFDRRAALPMALVIASASMSSFLTKPIANLVGKYSYRAGWYFIMGLCVLAFVITFFFIRSDVEECGEVPDSVAWRTKNHIPLHEEKAEGTNADSGKDGNAEAMKSAAFWIIGICSLCRMGVYAGSNAYVTQIILSRGFTAAEAGLCLASLTLSSTVGRLTTPVVKKVLRVSNQVTNVLGFVIMFVGCMLLVTSQSLGGFSFAIMCMGYAYGLGYVSQTLALGDMFPNADFASMLGLFNTVVNCSFVFPIAVGFIGKALGQNYLPIYTVFGFINIIAAGILVLMLLKNRAAAKLRQ